MSWPSKKSLDRYKYDTLLRNQNGSCAYEMRLEIIFWDCFVFRRSTFSKNVYVHVVLTLEFWRMYGRALHRFCYSIISSKASLGKPMMTSWRTTCRFASFWILPPTTMLDFGFRKCGTNWIIKKYFNFVTRLPFPLNLINFRLFVSREQAFPVSLVWINGWSPISGRFLNLLMMYLINDTRLSLAWSTGVSPRELARLTRTKQLRKKRSLERSSKCRYLTEMKTHTDVQC